MELSEWCEQVPHGQYFQPIRLHVDGVTDATPAPASPPPAVSVAAPADAMVAPSTPPRNGNSATSNGAAASPGSTTPKRLKRRQKPAPTTPRKLHPISDADSDGTMLLPPFQSAHVGSNRVALNVGGPVWAMDWLPHDVYRATVAVSTKHKKAASSAAANNNKENVNKNVSGSAATNGSISSSKDPLAEWRLLALSTHPPCTVVDGELVKNTPPNHHYDAPHGGRNLIQIWAIPVTKTTTLVSNGQSDAERQRRLPRLVYAIDHQCGVAWDVQWSPLTHKMARYRQADGLLGVLAVAFGDGSLQVFEVPIVPPEKLQVEPCELTVVRLQPIATGKIDRVIQLSVRWSPHHPNLILTGCSDGSVALWNLEEVVSKSTGDDGDETHEMEPQRRFQDADTIGKQEPFDWGWGWVAVRAVCWSPFDEHLFATTGNDSLFKIWDIREPRICFRSHRIRSTWGLALQWMDDTSVQISGDQGSIYMYDVLSGSYQKLHFHPQIDSPVWDLQFARRGRFPLLISSCTSGSIRLAPAKKIFRAPQHSVEICRLQGEKNSNVEQAHKSLTLSFEHRIVSGSAEAASPATREFCERDASLHRVRLSTNESGEYPCFLASGGHAGLVVIMEMQEDLDHLFENYFLQPSKKIGRPRKTDPASSPWNGRKIGQEKPKKVVASPKIKRVSGVKLSSFVQPTGTFSKAKPAPKKAKTKSEFPAFEMESPAASASEAEYQEGESDSDSDELSLADDNSDDDRVVGSDEDAGSDNVELLAPPENPNEARLRHEYQMDLSEEDAIMLAIQMSQLEQSTQPTQASTASDTKSSPQKAVAGKASAADQTTSRPQSEKPTQNGEEKKVASKMKTSTSSKKTKGGKKVRAPSPEPKGSVIKVTKPSSSKKKQIKQAAKSPEVSVPDRQSPQRVEPHFSEEMDQASIQMLIYQQGMTEEDAFREAIRMSEADMGNMRRSNRKRKAPPPEGLSSTPSTQQAPKSRKRPTPQAVQERDTPSATTQVAATLFPDDVARRLEFANTSPQQAVQSATCPAPTLDDTKGSAEKKLAPPLPPKSRAKPVISSKKNAAVKESEATEVDKAIELESERISAAAENALTTPTQPIRKPAQWPSTTTKSAKKTPSSSAAKKAKVKRASGGGGAEQFLTDEELLAIALQTSQIEY